MSTPAIVMMIVSMVIIWGGLLFAVLHLMRADASRAGGSQDPHGG